MPERRPALSKPRPVNHSLAAAGVVALTLLQPAVTLAAPPGGLRAYRPAPPRPHPAAASPSRNLSTGDRFQVPFHVDVQAKPLPEQRQSDAIKGSPDVSWRPGAYRRGWVTAPKVGYLWYQPAWLQPMCHVNNAFTGAPNSSTAQQDVKIGSLVDKNSRNLFSMAPSHKPEMAISDDGSATASSGLKYEFQAAPCGSANSVNF
jgi:hypothetical protein